MKVLYLITELNVGGAERALARLVARVDRHRFAPTVACLYGLGLVAEEIQALGVDVHCLEIKSALNLRAFVRLYRLVHRLNPTILHSFMFHANLLGRLVGRLANVPIVISAERTMGQESQNRLILNRLTAPLADRITAVSKAVGDFVVKEIGLASDKVVVIPNGVDLETYGRAADRASAKQAIGLESHFPLIGVVSNLRPVKGVSYLIQAFVQVIQSYPDACLLIVGDGPERVALNNLAADLGIVEQTLFVGERFDIPNLLAAMNVFALSSLWEGMPNAALEAMAAGLPVVATRVGGTPEVVEHGVTGLLVPPRDPKALAEAIIALLQDRERAEAMGQAGRERVEKCFSVKRMVQQTEALYEELIREKMGLEWVEGEEWQPI